MNELTGLPCNRRKHLWQIRFYFSGSFCLFFKLVGRSWLDEAVFVEAYAVAQQRPYRGQKLTCQSDQGHLRRFPFLQPCDPGAGRGEQRAAT